MVGVLRPFRFGGAEDVFGGAEGVLGGAVGLK